MKTDNAYYASIWRISKYFIYIRYFIEYLKYGDFKSIKASIRHLMTGKGAKHNYFAKSRMGKFLIRKGTTDFQFINWQYERSVKNYLNGKDPESTYFMDIGACIGEYCVWLTKKGMKCIAFEPVNDAAIISNIEIQSVYFKVLSIAVSDKREVVYFNKLDTITGSSHVSEKGEIEVQTDTVDNLYRIMHVDPGVKAVVMKLDVEGHEIKVLEGAKDFIRATKNLEIIYERYPGDDTVDKKLRSIAHFDIRPLDKYNYLAVKHGL